MQLGKHIQYACPFDIFVVNKTLKINSNIFSDVGNVIFSSVTYILKYNLEISVMRYVLLNHISVRKYRLPSSIVVVLSLSTTFPLTLNTTNKITF